jgi:hypothetical protein
MGETLRPMKRSSQPIFIDRGHAYAGRLRAACPGARPAPYR